MIPKIKDLKVGDRFRYNKKGNNDIIITAIDYDKCMVRYTYIDIESNMKYGTGASYPMVGYGDQHWHGWNLVVNIEGFEL